MRKSIDQLFLDIAIMVGEARGTCDRGRSGAVVARGNQLLSIGYVGAPAGLPHCDEVGHLMITKIINGKESQHCVRTTHAEINALLNASKNGVATDGATIYSKMEPCSDCANAIINAGIKRVVCAARYHAGASDRLRQAGIEVVILNDAVTAYPNQ